MRIKLINVNCDSLNQGLNRIIASHTIISSIYLFYEKNIMNTAW